MAITHAVGRNARNRSGYNRPDDVLTIQRLMNAAFPRAHLRENGRIDEDLIGLIERFQRDQMRIRHPDGYISPNGRTWRVLIDATSSGRLSLLSPVRVARPAMGNLRRAFNAYRLDSQPCKRRRMPNQCAIRLSIALYRSGFHLNGITGPVHHSPRSCHLSIPHVAGANQLASYLQRKLGTPTKFRHQDHASAVRQLQGQQGIIYFDNCYRRRGRSAKQGDHIDLWVGDRYFNQILHVSAGGNSRPDAHLFEQADGGVWFWPLG